MISVAMLEIMSADFEKVSEDLFMAMAFEPKKRIEALKHVLGWINLNAPKLARVIEREEAENAKRDNV